MPTTLKSGERMPEITLPKAGGGQVRLGGARERWQMVVVYRGRHCPICKRFLGRLEGLRGEVAAANTELVAVSADSAEQAESAAREWGLGFDVAYGMSDAQMRALGLYISHPRSAEETDHDFPEPGLFVVDPEGRAHMIEVANAPFVRPDLDGVLGGIRFVQDKGYPIRGTAD